MLRDVLAYLLGFFWFAGNAADEEEEEDEDEEANELEPVAGRLEIRVVEKAEESLNNNVKPRLSAQRSKLNFVSPFYYFLTYEG